MRLTPGWKVLPEINVTSLRVTKTNVFIALTPGVNVIKLFFFIADDEAK